MSARVAINGLGRIGRATLKIVLDEPELLSPAHLARLHAQLGGPLLGAARANQPRSWQMFCAALRRDVADIQGGTTSEGIHLGAMAGTVDLVQRCYTGIEPRGNVLHMDPCLPDELERLRTEVRYRRQTLDLEVDHEVLRVSSRPGTATPVAIACRGHFREISPGQSYEFRLVKPRAGRTPCAPAGLETAGKG